MSEPVNLTKLRKIMAAARPVVSKWLDVSEEMAGFSELCRGEKLDWSQIKALLKAQEQDHRDGKDRVSKLLAKAGKALDYAQALEPVEPRKNISREEGPRKIIESADGTAHDAETGEIMEQNGAQRAVPPAVVPAAMPEPKAAIGSGACIPPLYPGSQLGDPGEIPAVLRRH